MKWLHDVTALVVFPNDLESDPHFRLNNLLVMEPYFGELLKEASERTKNNATCNIDLQQNCLSAKKYNVAYVRSMNRYRFDFGSQTEGSSLCDIACTQVRGLRVIIISKISLLGSLA